MAPRFILRTYARPRATMRARGARQVVRAAVLVGCFAAFALAATTSCKRAPMICAKFARQDGSRASLTQLDKPTSTFVWSECADQKQRSLSCTTGHLHKLSCTCELKDGEVRTERRVKTDEGFPEDQASATAFTNKWCEFGLK